MGIQSLVFLSLLAVISNAENPLDPQSRLWISSPYLDHQRHVNIVNVLRDAGYDVKDYTPKPMDPNKPPMTRIVPGPDGTYYEVYPYSPYSAQYRSPISAKCEDGFTRRNGVVNGYSYLAKRRGYADYRTYFEALKRDHGDWFDSKDSIHDNTLVVTPNLSRFTLEEDLHTFISAPQSDKAVVLNHHYRTILAAAEKNSDITGLSIRFLKNSGTIQFLVKFVE